LYAFAKLSEKGLDVDAAAVRAVSDAARRVAGEMVPQAISNILWWAVAKLSEKEVNVDEAAVRAVSDEAARVAGVMNPQAVANTIWAWGTLVANGFQLTSVFGDSSWRAVNTRATEVRLHMNAQERDMTQRGVGGSGHHQESTRGNRDEERGERAESASSIRACITPPLLVYTPLLGRR
jgi:hypothetical protein